MPEVGSSTARVSLYVLPERVHIGVLPHGALASAFLPLTRLLFFSEAPLALTVVSLVRDEHGTASLSVIGSADDLAPLAESGMRRDDTAWAVVQVSEGSVNSFEAVGVVERIARPLAAAGVPVLYISTYSTDYGTPPLPALLPAVGAPLSPLTRARSAHPGRAARRGTALPLPVRLAVRVCASLCARVCARLSSARRSLGGWFLCRAVAVPRSLGTSLRCTARLARLRHRVSLSHLCVRRRRPSPVAV